MFFWKKNEIYLCLLRKPDVRIALYCYRGRRKLLEEGEKITQYVGGSYGIRDNEATLLKT
jgi:hypothetical protein